MFGTNIFSLLLVCLSVSLTLLPCSSSLSNSSSSSPSSHRCHPDESLALLQFRNSFTTFGYVEPWNNGTDCCEWEGITCDPTTHHVIGLDLSGEGILGMLKPNSSLFLLRHLQSLDLSGNDFSNSSISPQFGQFPSLTFLSLVDCGLTGKVPGEVAQLSRLQYLDLSYNYDLQMHNFMTVINNLTQLTTLCLAFVNLSTPFPTNLIALRYLECLGLSNCNLYGTIPPQLFSLGSLQEIYLDNNHLSGPINFYPNITHTNMSMFMLNSNDLSGNISLDILSKFPNIRHFWLGGSGLSVTLPTNMTFTRPSMLEALDLSNCNIHGEVPRWMPQVWVDSLMYLNLSHNSLEGSLANFSLKSLQILDISTNMLQGPIHTSFCNSPHLSLLDLSDNNFTGEIPHCLGNLSYLSVLHLGSNNLQGTLPTSFLNCSTLEFLDLSANWLQGLVPQSITRCSSLRFLNLRSNNFTDRFPHWLAFLPALQVLDLSSNNFHGLVANSEKDHQFPMLQILDLSDNNFSGKIPTRWIKNFMAMMKTYKENGGPEYMESLATGHTCSVVLTFNGQTITYQKIINSLFTLDLSNNSFEGEIPSNIGDLIALHGLNLSHNHFTGSIPSSIGNLTLLNCLDLSHNMLTGHIPQDLLSLTAMGVFNVSENQLSGGIPHGENFNTYDNNSYEGNPGLCGFPLPDCGEDGKPKPRPQTSGSEDDDDDDDGGIFMLSEWKVVVLGYASGTIVGLAWGYYVLSVGRPFWAEKLAYKLELVVLDFYEKQFGRLGRRAPRR